jgi:hypothetical protein
LHATRQAVHFAKGSTHFIIINQFFAILNNRNFPVRLDCPTQLLFERRLMLLSYRVNV